LRTRRSDSFTTITVAGQVLPADLLQRIADKDKELGGLGADSYHLSPSETISEATSRAWNKLVAAWGNFTTAKSKLPANDPATTITRERWLLPLFQELGYGRLPTSRSAVEIDGKGYAISHWWSSVPIHLVGAGVSIDKLSARIHGAARSSPHSLVQELLNRSEESLWGFVSNGLQLRILRDNQNLVRQAYVEFDLETMMEGEAYSDFVMLWLLCHQSRVEAEKPTDYWLEKWSRAAQERGVRALEHLREGVEEAIALLGSGFLAHKANGNLKEKLRSGLLNKQDYYRQLLRLIYRLLFLFVAEDRIEEKNRSLLFDPAATAEACERYTNFYSTKKLRRLAERRHGSRHSDLYAGLRLVMQKLGSDLGCLELGLPALGSFLFSENAMSDLNNCEIANHDLLDAVRALAFAADSQARRPIDYKNLGSEELGSVYESLLELHPDVNADAATFTLSTAAGHERKTTGSYYTPDSLVQCLLDSALDPVVREREANFAKLGYEGLEEAILDLKICDPSCGSGHFLIGAAHRLAKHLATARTGDDQPPPKAIRHAIRDVVGRCIYGVDVNPMAVELCKVSLWMEALEPGKPLSFLDHHIQCGNSLIGSTPTSIRNGIPDEAFKPIEGDDRALCREYKKQNRRERETHQQEMFDHAGEPWHHLGNLPTALVELEGIPDDQIAGVHGREQRWDQLVRSSTYRYATLLADAWCAAFVWKKSKSPALPYPITEEVFRKIEESPFNIAGGWMEKEIIRLSEQYSFLHWHLVFPDVFRVPTGAEEPENAPYGWSGGFDVVLANPPWERVKLQEKEWFATRRPDIANARNAATRSRLIRALDIEDPALYLQFEEALREADGESHLLRNGGLYPLCGRGDINLYAVFAEGMRNHLGQTGRVGCIVPTGIGTDDSNKHFIETLVSSKSLVSFFDFTNRGHLFPGTESTVSFSLLTFSNLAQEKFRVAAQLWRLADLTDDKRAYSLTQEDILRINPNTLNLPIFRSARDASLNKKIYENVPILLRETQDANPWQPAFSAMFHMTNDAPLFRTRGQLLDEGWLQVGNTFGHNQNAFVPLYEAKLAAMFNHRAATFDGIPEGEIYGTRAGTIKPKGPDLADPDWVIIPRYWVPRSEVVNRIPDFWRRSWLVGFRNAISSVADARSVTFTIFPLWGAGNSIPLLFPCSDLAPACLLIANFNSFVLDYVTKQKASGGNLNFYVVKQLPLLPPTSYAQACPWQTLLQPEGAKACLLEEWLLPRVLELTYTAWDLQSFAIDCEYDGPPFRWDEDRRFLLRCELDAAFFHLYLGTDEDWSHESESFRRYFPTPRHAVDYIMDTFSVAERKDEERYGEYRTKRVILDIYHEMAQAMATSQSYQTRLDPPPADPAVAHRPRFDLLPLSPPSGRRYSLNDDEAYVMRMILEMVHQGGGRIETELMMKGCALLAMPDLLEARGAELVGEVAHEWRQRLCDSFQPSLFMVVMRDLVSRAEINLISHGSAGSTTVRVEGSIRVQDAEIEFDARIALRVASVVSEAGLGSLPVLATKQEIESLYSAAA
jgi:hypothetical protein